jgi:hypothetical protein
MSLVAAIIVMMQANTAIPDAAQRLEPGRWVLRTSAERGTGLGGLSASLQSNDRLYRLVVRCDFSYGSNISIQFMRDTTQIEPTALPVTLTRNPDDAVIPLVWEATPAGVFARDGDIGPSATPAADFLVSYHGELQVAGRDQSGRSIKAVFDAGAGHQAIARTIQQCATLPRE